MFSSRLIRNQFDSCPDIEGMLSIKKQKLLNLTFACLPAKESYFEIGTYKGKSLVSAAQNNPERTIYACDNFSQFEELNNCKSELMSNLTKYKLKDKTIFYDMDFNDVFTKSNLSTPVGFYFFDGPHDYESQYQAIKKVEEFLADEAIIFVDDWRYARDSKSHAKKGTLDAINESSNNWDLLYELPAKFNGDHTQWWNGFGVLSFSRK